MSPLFPDPANGSAGALTAALDGLEGFWKKLQTWPLPADIPSLRALSVLIPRLRSLRDFVTCSTADRLIANAVALSNAIERRLVQQLQAGANDPADPLLLLSDFSEVKGITGPRCTLVTVQAISLRPDHPAAPMLKAAIDFGEERYPLYVVGRSDQQWFATSDVIRLTREWVKDRSRLPSLDQAPVYIPIDIWIPPARK